MKARICICCGERMARGAKVSKVNPHVCIECHVIVLGNEDNKPSEKARSTQSGTKPQAAASSTLEARGFSLS